MNIINMAVGIYLTAEVGEREFVEVLSAKTGG